MSEAGTPTPDRELKGSAAGIARSEEELRIATELVETGRARLVKRVESETVTRTIELRREVLQIERLPASAEGDSPAPGSDEMVEADLPVIQTGPLAAGSFQHGTVEVVLMQEEALITTQMVPRERVRLTKQIVTEQRTVDADLQAERVELEQRPQGTRPSPSGADGESDL
jgi:stress response protein YsnF